RSRSLRTIRRSSTGRGRRAGKSTTTSWSTSTRERRRSSRFTGSGRDRPSHSHPWSSSSDRGGMCMATALLIVHGLVAVALLGAVTHQALAPWLPARAQPGSFVGRVRAVPATPFAGAVAVLYGVSAVLGAILYLPFRVEIRPVLESANQWSTLGIFDV